MFTFLHLVMIHVVLGLSFGFLYIVSKLYRGILLKTYFIGKESIGKLKMAQNINQINQPKTTIQDPTSRLEFSVVPEMSIKQHDDKEFGI